MAKSKAPNPVAPYEEAETLLNFLDTAVSKDKTPFGTSAIVPKRGISVQRLIEDIGVASGMADAAANVADDLPFPAPKNKLEREIRYLKVLLTNFKSSIAKLGDISAAYLDKDFVLKNIADDVVLFDVGAELSKFLIILTML